MYRYLKDKLLYFFLWNMRSAGIKTKNNFWNGNHGIPNELCNVSMIKPLVPNRNISRRNVAIDLVCVSAFFVLGNIKGID